MPTDQSPEVTETEVKIETQASEGGTPNGKETREQRDLMKTLSAEVFGKSSRYQKMFEYDEVLIKEVDEVVPGENGVEDSAKKVRVPILLNGSKQSRRKYRTVEQVIEVLQKFKVSRDEIIAQMKAQQETAAAAKEAELNTKKLQEELGGSALT